MAYECPNSRRSGARLSVWEQIEYHVVIFVLIIAFVAAAPFKALFRTRKSTSPATGMRRGSIFSKAVSEAQIAAGYAFMR